MQTPKGASGVLRPCRFALNEGLLVDERKREPLHMITSLHGASAKPLGLAAHPEQDRGCVRRAFERGVNFFFFYGPSHQRFIEGLAPLVRRQRDKIILATGSGARKRNTLMAGRRKILTALDTHMGDVFFAEYIGPHDDPDAVFGANGVLDELQRWKADGWIRYVGATAHDRAIAKRLAEDARVDLLMHRFNMAHRKAKREVFPNALKTKTPVVAFTATRWGTLLKPHADWSQEPPTAADCYRYCLAQSAVHVVLTAPKSADELAENLEVLNSATMSKKDCRHWEKYGNLVYGRGKDAYETQWP